MASVSAHPTSQSPESTSTTHSAAHLADDAQNEPDLKTGGKSKATAAKPKRRFVGKNSMSTNAGQSRPIPHSSIPADILQDPLLADAIAHNLPKNYEFEVHKTIWNIRKWDCKMVALQMPEGLLMWGCILSDIIERFTSAQTVILGDVTYGACCIDDYTAIALGCDMLVHYGHSCLVPIENTRIRTLYVFVEISIDSEHLAKTIRRNFPSDRDAFVRDVVRATDSAADGGVDVPIGSVLGGRKRIEADRSHKGEIELELSNEPAASPSSSTRLALVSTIQFAAALNRLKEDLSSSVEDGASITQKPSESVAESHLPIVPHATNQDLDAGRYEIVVPRSKPLSPGEILGCTAPRLNDVDAILYLADGRFHLEAIMIANPSLPAFRYDPYSKKLTREWYDHEEMRSVRGSAIKSAKATLPSIGAPAAESANGVLDSPHQPSTLASGQVWGVILGTLGRQGSLLQMEAILRQLETYRITDTVDSSTVARSIPYMPILLSELSPAKLALFNEGIDPNTTEANVTTFIQTSCPRLSIDWGYAFQKPLLNPYEAAVVLGRAQGWEEEQGQSSGGQVTKEPRSLKGAYPMDFYEAGSVWAVSRVKGRETSWPVDVVVH